MILTVLPSGCSLTLDNLPPQAYLFPTPAPSVDLDQPMKVGFMTKKASEGDNLKGNI